MKRMAGNRFRDTLHQLLARPVQKLRIGGECYVPPGSEEARFMPHLSIETQAPDYEFRSRTGDQEYRQDGPHQGTTPRWT
jgi:hypothetical protein